LKSPQSIDVLFVVLPDTLLLDWAGPAEAFRIANAIGATRERVRFNMQFVGPDTAARSSVGALVSDLAALPSTLPAGGWVILSGSPSQPVHARRAATKQVIDWLRKVRPGSDDTRLITICSGALLAAHAGLLKERSATTHHQSLDALCSAETRCKVLANRVFVNDGSLWSSAGVTTGIDLALHLISEQCGPATAAQVAQTMVVPMRRGPRDPEISPLLAYRNHLHAAVHRVQDAISEDPTQDWTLPRMARIAHASERHLTRLFVEQTGTTPINYLRSTRLAAAELLLRAGHSVTRAAELSGFRSDTQLRRAWRAIGRVGSPSSAIEHASTEGAYHA
jgi:transcriptional regulator GlxA family with amidase domain